MITTQTAEIQTPADASGSTQDSGTGLSHVIPVELRRLYREYKRKPNVYGSKFAIPVPLEVQTTDGRTQLLIGVEIKEGCHPGTYCLGHAYVRTALKRGGWSPAVYAYGWGYDDPAVNAVIAEAHALGSDYLDAHTPDFGTEIARPGEAITWVTP